MARMNLAMQPIQSPIRVSLKLLTFRSSNMGYLEETAKGETSIFHLHFKNDEYEIIAVV